MFTEGEYVLIKSFDREIDRVVGERNAAVAHQDNEIGAAARIIVHLQGQLAAANARAAAAEARTAGLLRQIQNSLN